MERNASFFLWVCVFGAEHIYTYIQLRSAQFNCELSSQVRCGKRQQCNFSLVVKAKIFSNLLIFLNFYFFFVTFFFLVTAVIYRWNFIFAKRFIQSHVCPPFSIYITYFIELLVTLQGSILTRVYIIHHASNSHQEQQINKLTNMLWRYLLNGYWSTVRVIMHFVKEIESTHLILLKKLNCQSKKIYFCTISIDNDFLNVTIHSV